MEWEHAGLARLVQYSEGLATGTTKPEVKNDLPSVYATLSHSSSPTCAPAWGSHGYTSILASLYGDRRSYSIDRRRFIAMRWDGLLRCACDGSHAKTVPRKEYGAWRG